MAAAAERALAAARAARVLLVDPTRRDVLILREQARMLWREAERLRTTSFAAMASGEKPPSCDRSGRQPKRSSRAVVRERDRSRKD